jgi:hypothetical protein
MIRAIILVLCSASVALAQQAPAKRCATDLHRQFDFWIGTWDVHNAKGDHVGENEIASNGPCYLLEQWRGDSGSRGASLNFVNPAGGKWTQDWVDNSGGRIEIQGEWSEGAMLLIGEHTLPNGTTRPFRGTWTPLEDGRVRQHFEEIQDAEAGWATWFDGYYTKRKN